MRIFRSRPRSATAYEYKVLTVPRVHVHVCIYDRVNSRVCLPSRMYVRVCMFNVRESSSTKEYYFAVDPFFFFFFRRAVSIKSLYDFILSRLSIIQLT